jgi:uracil-DNA glycosylase
MDIKKQILNIKTDWKIPLLKNKKVEIKLEKPFEIINRLLIGSSFKPNKNEIFRSLNYFNLRDTKVVILGQDPYPNPLHPNGLAFSVNRDIKKLPPTLKNIIKESKYKLKNNTDDYLEDWARQGVLLLNTVLTIRPGSSQSHSNYGWEKVTDAIIQLIDKNVENAVFLLWGRVAAKKIDNINNCQYIITSHPSPLSANKGYNPFIGSDCFLKVNKKLKEMGENEIKW